MPLRLPFVILLFFVCLSCRGHKSMNGWWMDGWMDESVQDTGLASWSSLRWGLGEIGSAMVLWKPGECHPRLFEVHPEMVGCQEIHQLHQRSATQWVGELKPLNYPSHARQAWYSQDGDRWFEIHSGEFLNLADTQNRRVVGFEHWLFGPEVVRGPKCPNSMCIVFSRDGFSQGSATLFLGIPMRSYSHTRQINHQLSSNQSCNNHVELFAWDVVVGGLYQLYQQQMQKCCCFSET